MTLQIWTDGACEPNPGIGGWGWHSTEGLEAYGGELETTNNRMEMTAILEALSKLPDGTPVIIHSDSQYCIRGLTEWRKGWRQKNWHRQGEPMPNRDLWVLLEKQLVRLLTDFKWVKGHNGNEGNEKADRLAGMGRKSLLKDGESPARQRKQESTAKQVTAPTNPPTQGQRIEALESRISYLENLIATMIPHQ